MKRIASRSLSGPDPFLLLFRVLLLKLAANKGWTFSDAVAATKARENIKARRGLNAKSQY